MTGRPIPEVTPLTAPYWEAAQQRRLDLQRCEQCHRYVHFPEFRCPFCMSSELTYQQVSGDGAIATFSVVHRTAAPGYDRRIPYVIAWVDLAEQEHLRAFGNVVGCDPQRVSIGMPVRVCYEEIDGFGLVPNFTAA